jgi:hypothetical protein
MDSNPFSGLGSAFDKLLAKDRDWFNEQLNPAAGRQTPGPVSAGRLPPAPAAPRPSTLPKTPGPAGAGPSVETSAPVKFLEARFGKDWRYEVASRQRSGDELVVLCKLTLAQDGVTRSQFGKARVLKPGVPRQLAGTVDGIPFQMQVDQGLAPGQDPEEAAYRRAVIDALSKCTETL